MMQPNLSPVRLAGFALSNAQKIMGLNLFKTCYMGLMMGAWTSGTQSQPAEASASLADLLIGVKSAVPR